MTGTHDDLTRLFLGKSAAGLDDRQLLARFVEARDEHAFAALVARHGPMVLRTCRAALGDRHGAHDAFQATFLVLARRARSLWVGDSLGPWLHGVAVRVSARARAEAGRRWAIERAYAGLIADTCPARQPECDEGPALHEEIVRLPERYRLPIVLCDLQGLSHAEAALRLGWPVGTVKSRQARARERLRIRLARRGLGPMVFAPAGLAGPVPETLAGATAVAAGRFARVGAGTVPATVARLMEGAMDTMLMHKLTWAAAWVVAAGLASAGAVLAARQAGPRTERAVAATPAPNPSPPAAATPAPTDPAGPPEASEVEAAVRKELHRLDMELLEEDVARLRERVRVTYRAKVVARPEDGDTRHAYESARDEYARALRKLIQGRDRPEGSDPPPSAIAPAEATRTPDGVGIGTVDLDAVFRKWTKVKGHTESYDARQAARQKTIDALRADLDAAKDDRNKAAARDPEEAARLNEKVRSLYSAYLARLKANERESLGEAEAVKRLYLEVQRVVDELARARGLDYVAKVSNVTDTNAGPAEIMSLKDRIILYADPSSDLTAEVIRILNERHAETKHAEEDTPQDRR